MNKKLIGIRIILALAMASTMVAVSSGPVLAKEAPPAADNYPQISLAAVPGSVWAWGTKGSTGLGDGKTFDSKVPVPLSGLSGVVDIAAGDAHAMALKEDGTVWAWGLNSQGQLGDGTTTSRNIPVKVSGLSGITSIAAGGSHSLAVKDDGSIYAWGDNSYGQLGVNTVINKLVPVPVFNVLTGVVAVAAGKQHSLAVKSDGSVWAWGLNTNGQLGDGTTTNRLTPVQIIAGSSDNTVKAIAGGEWHSLQLTENKNTAAKSGTVVKAWGYNVDGAIGATLSPSIPQVTMPQTVLDKAIAIAAGSRHSLAVGVNGTVWAWGRNDNGQLGDGTTTTKALNRFPAPISGLTGAKSVAAGASHSLVLKENGEVWAWGYNYYGQLGDNTTTTRSTPVQVIGLTGVTAIAARTFYSLAIKNDTLNPVLGVGPITATPAPVSPPLVATPPAAPTPNVTANPQTPAPITVTPGPAAVTPAPVTVTPQPVAPTTPRSPATGAAPIPVTGLVPITKSTPRTAPTQTSSGILVYASPERIAGPGAGGVFSLSIWAAPGSRVISSGDLSLSFNATALEMVSITPGNIFGITPMIIQNDFNNSIGTARLVAARAAGSQAGTPPPPPIPAAAGNAGAATPAAGAGSAGAATPAAPGADPAVSEADRILAGIIAAADAEAARILADLTAAANAAANAIAGVLGIQTPPAPVADAGAPAHLAIEAAPVGGVATGTVTPAPAYHGAVPVTGGGTTSGNSSAGPPSGAAYFGSPETGFVASNSLTVIRFKVKPQAKPGDYQVSISKVGLADAKGQDIPVRLMTGSTITIGGAMQMGDLDGNGNVDYRDLGMFAAAYGTSRFGSTSYSFGADLNSDGVIDFRDLAIFGANYGK